MTLSTEPLPVAPGTAAKFAPGGEARSYPGMSVLTDLVDDEGTQVRLGRIAAMLAARPASAAHCFLPPESLHMTLFRGINDQRRNRPEWPDDLPLDLSLDEMAAVFASRLSGCTLAHRYRLRPLELKANATGELQLSLAGADEQEDRRLREARSELAARLRLRRGESDYRYHVTLSYRVRPADVSAEAELEQIAASAFDEFVRQVPVMTVEAPCLCVYADMLAFRKTLALSLPETAVL